MDSFLSIASAAKALQLVYDRLQTAMARDWQTVPRFSFTPSHKKGNVPALPESCCFCASGTATQHEKCCVQIMRSRLSRALIWRKRSGPPEGDETSDGPRRSLAIAPARKPGAMIDIGKLPVQAGIVCDIYQAALRSDRAKLLHCRRRLRSVGRSSDLLIGKDAKRLGR